MFKRFLALTLLMWLLSSVCVASTRIGQLFPVQRVLAFNPPGCELPCVLNIVPGLTTEQQVKTFVDLYTTANQNTAEIDWVHQVKGSEPNRPYIGLHYGYRDNSTYLYMIRISPGNQGYGSSVTELEKILAAGHAIKRVFRSSYLMGAYLDAALLVITFDEQEQFAAVVYAQGDLFPTSKVTDIYVIKEHFPAGLDEVRGNFHAWDEIRWLGFVPVKKYLEAPAIQ
jgi:hypothetical protein